MKKTYKCVDCGYKVVVFDNCLDIIMCPECESPDLEEV